MTKEIRALRNALRALFVSAEQTAVNGYTTYCDDGFQRFNDAIWRKNDPYDFKIAKRARGLLGLKPFNHCGKKSPNYNIRGEE